MLPLEHAPVYSPSELGGREHSQYWPVKAEYNVTQYNSKLRQYATSVNTMLEQGGLLEHTIKKRWPGASLTVFDVNALLKDILEDPGAYLSYPANVTGVYHSCPEGAAPEDCADSSNPLSSFFWYDDLHPTERVVRIIAETFIKVVKRKSKYGHYYG
ncbi:hypothetical protein CEP52_002831 [Fusarium oligoseptatum]|uniref:Uncharacterized protein n=1 Tax=Fusarium oligoseptatum TaxID=2604345 RepID=A0A428UBL6_9HYPO|nr:hypothetical protein CEP52_002831 [Fusarium oligoseptatum]